MECTTSSYVVKVFRSEARVLIGDVCGTRRIADVVDMAILVIEQSFIQPFHVYL